MDDGVRATSSGHFVQRLGRRCPQTIWGARSIIGWTAWVTSRGGAPQRASDSTPLLTICMSIVQPMSCCFVCNTHVGSLSFNQSMQPISTASSRGGTRSAPWPSKDAVLRPGQRWSKRSRRRQGTGTTIDILIYGGVVAGIGHVESWHRGVAKSSIDLPDAPLSSTLSISDL
jgi:hypothetical protein